MVVDTQVIVLVRNYFFRVANLADVKGARPTLAPVLEDMVRIATILADSSYRDSITNTLEQAHNCKLRITRKLREWFVIAP